MLDRFLEAGGNFLDTADTYDDGGSEETLAPWLAGRRDEVVLATKVRFAVSDPGGQGLDPDRIRAACDASLRRLGVDEIDLYQVHAPDPERAAGGDARGARRARAGGQGEGARRVELPGWLLAWAVALQDRNGWSPFVSLQPQYSLVERSIETEILPFCRAAGLGVLPWGPLGAGFLTGRYSRDERAAAGLAHGRRRRRHRGGAGAPRDRAQLPRRRRGARDRDREGRDGLAGRAGMAAGRRGRDVADRRPAHVRAARGPARRRRRHAQRRGARAAGRRTPSCRRATPTACCASRAGSTSVVRATARRVAARGRPRSTTRRRRRARAGCPGGCDTMSRRRRAGGRAWPPGRRPRRRRASCGRAARPCGRGREPLGELRGQRRAAREHGGEVGLAQHGERGGAERDPSRASDGVS